MNTNRTNTTSNYRNMAAYALADAVEELREVSAKVRAGKGKPRDMKTIAECARFIRDWAPWFDLDASEVIARATA